MYSDWALGPFFAGIKQLMLDHGGDGWVAIVSREFRELADKFEAWDSQEKFPLKRQPAFGDNITFGAEQEFIVFTEHYSEQNMRGFEVVVWM